MTNGVSKVRRTRWRLYRELLRGLRLARRWSIQEAADSCKIYEKRQYLRLEKGETRQPRKRTLRDLVRGFGLQDESELILGFGDSPDPRLVREIELFESGGTATVEGLLDAISGIVRMKRTRFGLAKELAGKWFAGWEYDRRGSWVVDEVTLSVKDSKIVFEVVKPGKSFVWIIEGYLKRGRMIVGDWESIRPGATACGAVAVRLDPQGVVMCGYWVGPAEEPGIMVGKLVLAREQNRVEELRDATLFDRYL